MPDVDCILWCQPHEAGFYVQGMGRSVRIHPGKVDCLVPDFTDTVARLGPIRHDQGPGRQEAGAGSAPCCVCPDCGERNLAAALVCLACGATIKTPDVELKPAVVSAPLLSIQVAQQANTVTWHDVSRVDYAIHTKPDKPDSLRVDYFMQLPQGGVHLVLL